MGLSVCVRVCVCVCVVLCSTAVCVVECAPHTHAHAYDDAGVADAADMSSITNLRYFGFYADDQSVTNNVTNLHTVNCTHTHTHVLLLLILLQRLF